MTDRKMFSVRNVSKQEALEYLDKAQESISVAEEALAGGHWHVASQEAILGAIAANDAVLGLVYGVVPASLNHNDAVAVFRQRFTSDQDREYSKYLTRLIAKKKIVMYESRMPTRAEASGVVDDAKTFLAWVRTRTKDLRK